MELEFGPVQDDGYGPGWSPSPVAFMKGLMFPVLFTLMAHTHSKIAHLATSFLNKFFLKKKNL